MSLTLPEGSYQITVAGPAAGSEPQRISVRVEAGVAHVAPLVRFAVVTPEEYFEEYLTSPVTPAEQEPSPTPPAVPATPAVSTGAGQ
jgi:hypothetical protein